MSSFARFARPLRKRAKPRFPWRSAMLQCSLARFAENLVRSGQKVQGFRGFAASHASHPLKGVIPALRSGLSPLGVAGAGSVSLVGDSPCS